MLTRFGGHQTSVSGKWRDIKDIVEGICTRTALVRFRFVPLGDSPLGAGFLSLTHPRRKRGLLHTNVPLIHSTPKLETPIGLLPIRL